MEEINKMEALNSRGLDLGELLSLLPAAIKATANISDQIKLTKQGQKPAITVANVLNSTILVLNQAMNDADLTPEQLKETTNLDFFNFVTFILERLILFYIHNKNLKVCN
mgnify:CR=1 FL=1